MGQQSNRKLLAFLPLAIVATFLVVVAPVLLVLWLRRSGVVTSVWGGPVIGVAVSLLASYAGGAFWKTRSDSRDILFSDLMLWGWLGRWRNERRLAAASDLLGLASGRPKTLSEGQLTNEQKAGLLTRLTSGLEARDAYTHGHSRRVARYAASIAKGMGLSRAEVAKIRAAGAMHDVGKVETPLAVLRKDGKLTDEEFAVIKRHPVDGAKMVSILGDEELTAMVRHHHERSDGSGYPDRLGADAIPIGARILAVADTFDAITSTRPYRHANPHKKALAILEAEAGIRLDRDAVRAFCRSYSGRRPLAAWTVLANARPRLASWLGSGLAPAKAATVGNVMAAAAATSAIGGALVLPAADAAGLLSSPEARSTLQGQPLRAAENRNLGALPPRAPGPRGLPGESSEPAGSSRRPEIAPPDNLLAGLDPLAAGGVPTPAVGPVRDEPRPEADAPPLSREPRRRVRRPRDGARTPAGSEGRQPGPAVEPPETDDEGVEPPRDEEEAPPKVDGGGGQGNGGGHGQGNGGGHGQGNGGGQGQGNGGGHGQGNGGGQGQGNGGGQGQGNGGGQGQGNGGGQGPGNGGGQGQGNGGGQGQGNGGGQGQGNGQGNGDGHGQGNGGGQGQGRGQSKDGA